MLLESDGPPQLRLFLAIYTASCAISSDMRERPCFLRPVSSSGSDNPNHKSTTNSRTAFFVCAQDFLRYQARRSIG